jgi:hypothetical protein
MKILRIALMASVVAAGMGLFSTGPVSAFPLSPAAGGLAAQLDDAAPAVQVRFRGGGLAAGVIGGMVLGGIIASQRPYYYGYRYGYPAPYVYATPYGGSAVAYCMSRFKSYDPYSGTYLGYDGFRHPCP